MPWAKNGPIPVSVRSWASADSSGWARRRGAVQQAIERGLGHAVQAADLFGVEAGELAEVGQHLGSGKGVARFATDLDRRADRAGHRLAQGAALAIEMRWPMMKAAAAS